MKHDASIRQLASGQHGVISRLQLRELGADRDLLRTRLRVGLFEQLSPRVFRIAGSADTPAQQAIAAVLDVGERAVLSHSSAAGWWQFPGFSLSPVHTTRLRGGREQHSHLSTVHQPRALTDEHVTVLHGVPITSSARTIFDLAGQEPLGRTARALDFVLSRRLTTAAELHHLLRELARRGRPGITIMRQLLAERPIDGPRVDSNLEWRFLQLARRAGVTNLDAGVDIADETGWIAHVDFLHSARRVVIEIDSVLHHSSLTDRRRDDSRTARLMAAGYTVVRFTEVDVVFAQDWVVAELRTTFWQQNVG